MTEEMKGELAALGLDAASDAARRLEIFSRGLLEKNSLLNLVSKADEAQLWPRHILDSLAAVPALRRLLAPGALVADAGSGAGFPGLALAAVLEEFRFELLDSSGRRCAFLNWSVSAMRARNVAVFHRRLGEGGAAGATRYDAVLERAMGQLENILPQCLNILAPGGIFIAWQSSAQLARARPLVDETLRRAGAELSETLCYRLPGEKEDRGLAVFRKAGGGAAR